MTDWGSPAPRATPATPTCWPTWSAPVPTSCGRSPVSPSRLRRVKVVARTHKTLIWERTRHTQRPRHALRDYFPAALVVFEDLDAADTLDLPGKAPTPAQGGPADYRPDQRHAQTRPPPHCRRQSRRDPGRAAGRAPGPV